MKVEWDAAKASSNLNKRGIAFADAATAFHDEFALTIDADTGAEHRFVSLAMDALGRLLVTVYTLRNDTVRLISARRATKTETRPYAEAATP